MTRKKKIFISITIIVFGVVACIASYLYGFRQGIFAGGVTASMTEYTINMDHITDQMTNADCAGAKQAIYDYLDLVTKYKDKEGSFISSTTYYGDKMLGHTRLARIERYLKNYTEADNQMKKAIEACKQHNWKDCSEDKLIQFSKRLEEKHPIACLANEEK